MAEERPQRGRDRDRNREEKVDDGMIEKLVAVDRDQLLDHAIVDFFFAVTVAIATPLRTFFCHLDSLVV